MNDGISRVRRLVAAAAELADAGTELGQRARALLGDSTALSPEGVDWALRACLEAAPSDAELTALARSVTPAPAVHVILPSNVFVAAHRAIALALAASPHVRVRPSRREPHFARLLASAAPGLFEIVTELRVSAKDHVWAYGGDESLAAVRAQLPADVTLHAQGPGFGLAVVDATAVSPSTAHALACDLMPFDQRGCLSPRAALILGDAALTRRFAALLADAQASLAERIPLGRLDAGEQADVVRFRDAGLYAGALVPAGPGWLFVAADARPALAPVGRNLHLSPVTDLVAALSALGRERITTVGIAGPSELFVEVSRALPEARISELGEMQRPALDGPADRRSARAARLDGP
jgi:hypothetical protein